MNLHLKLGAAALAGATFLLSAAAARAEGEPGGAPASAEAPPQADAAAPAPAGALGTHQRHWWATLGVRTTLVRSAGYDVFSENDVLTQASLAGGRTLLVVDRWSVVAVGGWDFGAVTGEARGEESELVVHRLTAGIEGRYHVFPQLFGFGRLSPGALRVSATLADSVAGLTLHAGGEEGAWLPAADATLGGAVQLYGVTRADSRRARLWALLEGGYGWSGSTELQFRPLAADESSEAAPRRMATLDLGELALRGGTVRLAVAGSF
ncbi:MAG: hypothetical protein IT376_00220 [Polyangiaceae bacterium]|nr:hypothetical protein [Polyangiaceae bacterium]